MRVEPDRERRCVVDAAFQAARDVAEAEIGLQPFLGIDVEETLLEVGERRAAAQPVIGGQHRAAGDAGEKVEPVEERYRPGARRHPRLVETGENAIGERRRPHAAA